MCEPHDAANHAAAFDSHCRLPLSEKVAARQAAMTSKRAAAGAQLRSAARAAVQRLQRAISRQQADVDGGQPDSAAEAHQQLIQLQEQLKEVEAAATRISAMSDAQAQSHAAALAQLLQRLPPEDDAADAGSRESEGIHADKLFPSDPSSSSQPNADHEPTAASEQAAAAAVDSADPPGIPLTEEQLADLYRFLDDDAQVRCWQQTCVRSADSMQPIMS